MTRDWTRICVAVLTYRRATTLAALLDAFGTLTTPPGAVVHFLIVDNDPSGSGRETVERAQRRWPGVVLDYVIESKPGIAGARNRAIDEAQARDAVLLCFTDDDVVPSADWLAHMFACQRETGAALVVGPVRLVAPPQLRGWRRWFARSLVARADFVAKYATREWRVHRRIVTSATSNWLGELSWFDRHGLSFDPTLGIGGGEDTAFYDAVIRSGGTVAWCERGWVNESLPEERISIRYQWQRACANGMNTELLGRIPKRALIRHPMGRMLAGVTLMILPLIGAASFALGLQWVGMSWGMRRARRGERSNLYARENRSVDGK